MTSKEIRSNMKWWEPKIQTYLFSALIAVCLTSCQEKNDSIFIYSSEGKRIEMILENDAEYFVIGKTTKMDFVTENVNKRRLTVSGPGIRNHGSQADFRYTVTPFENTLVNGNLQIRVIEALENGERFSHIFLIPVKKQDE